MAKNKSGPETNLLLDELKLATQNPLEGLGLSRELVRQLDGDSLSTAVRGIVRALQKAYHPDVASGNQETATERLDRISQLYERFTEDPVKVRKAFLASKKRTSKAPVAVIRETKIDHTHQLHISERFDQLYSPDSVLNIRHALLLTKPLNNPSGNIIGLPWFSIESEDMHSSLSPYKVSRPTIAEDEGTLEMLSSIGLSARMAEQKAILIKDNAAQIIATGKGKSSQYNGEFDADFRNKAWYLTRGSESSVSLMEITPTLGTKSHDIQLLGTINPDVTLPLSPRRDTQTVENEFVDDTIYTLGEGEISSSLSLPQWVRSSSIPSHSWIEMLNSTGASDKTEFRPTLEVGRILIANILDYNVRVALGEICVQDVAYRS